MRLSKLTRPYVLQAIEKCNKIGRQKFLEEGRFEYAREYFLLYEGHAYDSKAIVGAAWSLMTGDPYVSEGFSGGYQLTERLKQLGFDLTPKMSWQLEELILVCDLLDRNDWQTVPEDDPRTVELSALLRAQWVYAPDIPEYRSPHSVYLRLEDLRSARRSQTGGPAQDRKLIAQVAAAFVDDPTKMRALAEQLRVKGELDRVLNHDQDDERPGEAEPDLSSADEFVAALEGKARQRITKVYERDPQLRKKKIKQSRRLRGGISCEICGFDFEKFYPGLGDGYVHVHHVTPLHTTGEVRNTVDDLVLVCANCHQMIHRPAEYLTPVQLREIIATKVHCPACP